jgi:hypothetical protein
VIAQTAFRTEEFRKHLQAMSDEQLIRYGKAARYIPIHAACLSCALFITRKMTPGVAGCIRP